MSGVARQRGLRTARETRASEPPADPPRPENEQEMQDAPAPEDEQGTGSHTPQEDAPGDEEMQTPEPETLKQRYERLKAEVAIRRMQREVEAMEREIASDIPAPRIGDAGPSVAGHKRGVSNSAEVSDPQRNFFYRPKSPPIFEGKTLKEVSTFKARWDVQFAAMPPMDESKRVAVAATGLRGLPLESWGRKTQAVDTWDGFVDWCRNLVKDPANRTMHAYLKLKEAKQRKTQSVRDFVSYIEEQEKDIPDEQDDTLRKAWSLLVGLDEDIRRGVMIEHKQITSREQVIIAAQRQEELLRNTRDGREDATASQTSGKRSARPPRERSSGTFMKPLTIRQKEERLSRPESDRRCYNCHKLGHIARDCTHASKVERKGSASASPAPPKKD